VTLQKQDDNLQMSLKFRIDARLAVDPAPDVAFDTILEVGTGKYLVSPAAA
jgi:predicted component of type VI protein secretion system